MWFVLCSEKRDDRNILILKIFVYGQFLQGVFYLFVGCQLYRSHDLAMFCRRSYSNITLLSAPKAFGWSEDIDISSQRLARLIVTYA